MKMMLILREAWAEQCVLRIEYRKRDAYLAEVRDIEVYAFDVRYIDAYCRLRQDPRSFRIDRIVRAALLEETLSIDPAIEGILTAQGWVNRTAAWRRERMESIHLDKICDKLFA